MSTQKHNFNLVENHFMKLADNLDSHEIPDEFEFGPYQIIKKTFEPPRDKTNNVAVHPAKTQISLGIRPV